MTAALEALVVACEIVIEDGVLDDGYYANGAKRFRAAVSAARNSLTVIPPACEGCGKPATVQVAAGQCVMEWCPACHASMLADYADGLCLGCRDMRGTCANGCEPIAPSDFHSINTERAS